MRSFLKIRIRHETYSCDYPRIRLIFFAYCDVGKGWEAACDVSQKCFF